MLAQIAAAAGVLKEGERGLGHGQRVARTQPHGGRIGHGPGRLVPAQFGPLGGELHTVGSGQLHIHPSGLLQRDAVDQPLGAQPGQPPGPLDPYEGRSLGACVLWRTSGTAPARPTPSGPRCPRSSAPTTRPTSVRTCCRVCRAGAPAPVSMRRRQLERPEVSASASRIFATGQPHAASGLLDPFAWVMSRMSGMDRVFRTAVRT